MAPDDNSVFMGDPQFPDNLPASAVWDAYPPSDSEPPDEVDLTEWSTEDLRELAIWAVHELAENPANEGMVELVDERPGDPLLMLNLPEHNVTPEAELDALDVL